mmetsp:Transcript_14239/g.40357  ORF Transcript_14239/g.40357 Transcript_14239/m.40357 type:complete len:214 (-) Transcript_14239:263-904(-)
MAAPAVEEVEIFTGHDGERRVKDREVVMKVCIGTVAFWLGKKASEHHSHKWTVYVRGAEGQDISHLVAKVTFQLHASFPNPIRTVEKPPYELTETGWGEFEIGVQLHFREDARAKEIELFHPLKLYSEAEGQQGQVSKKPVVSEEYDEIVFSEPPEAFYKRVMATPPQPAPTSTLAPHFITHSSKEELARIQAARYKAAQFRATLLKQLEGAA